MAPARWLMTVALAVSPFLSAWAIEGDGLIPDSGQQPHWQGRLSLSTLIPLPRTEAFDTSSSSSPFSNVGLLGDYYFSRPSGANGGMSHFRATSGLWIGSRAASLPSVVPSEGAFSLISRLDTALSDPTATPYVGVGYTSLSGNGRWGFSADVGMLALKPGSAVKFGRLLNGNQSLDEVLREMRLSPLLQIGVSYSF